MCTGVNAIVRSSFNSQLPFCSGVKTADCESAFAFFTSSVNTIVILELRLSTVCDIDKIYDEPSSENSAFFALHEKIAKHKANTKIFLHIFIKPP